MFTYECCAISRYLLILFVYIQLINAVLLEPFYWNTTTFRPYRNSEISFDVRLGDAMDVVCPYYNEQQSYMTNDLEYYDIYQVTENEYETCRIYSLGDNRLTRLVISCNSPHEIMKYTLNFREYLPIPNGFEFNAGHTYYFISTSDSTEFGRQDMESGSCEKHSTRIKIHVGRRHQQYHPSTTTTTSSYPLRPATNSLSKYRNPIWTALRAERHSDSHSIAWITQWPKVDDDSNLDPGVKKSSFYVAPSSTILKRSTSSNVISLALSSSSSTYSIKNDYIAFFLCTFLCLLNRILSLR